MIQRQLHVERHDVVEIVAGREVSAAGVADQTLGLQGAEAAALDQRQLAGHVHTIDAGALVIQTEIEETVGARGADLADLGAGNGVDVVVDIGIVRRQLEAPAFLRRIVPVTGNADGVRHFRVEVEVADITVAVAIPVVHVHDHAVAVRPGVAFIQIGRTALHGITRLVGLGGIRCETRQRGQVEILVSLAAVCRIEGTGDSGRIGRVAVAHHAAHGVVAFHPAGVGLDGLMAQAELRCPLRVPARFPLTEDGIAVALAIVDIEESAGAHHHAGA